MKQLNAKRILLGVTGGIAVYKSAELVRLLVRQGAEVRVVMTRAAKEFVTPLTFQALSGNPVHDDLLDTQAEAAMGHIELARWADLILVAPATADFIARLANGQAGDLLTALCLASHSQVAIAPAMNQQMWLDPATTENIQRLTAHRIDLLGPEHGEQACGEFGPGRMLDVEQLLAHAAGYFKQGLMSGLTVLVTAGPTREYIDPVRYLSNRSSGKMGYAIAKAAIEAGAKVTLISGPVNLEVPERVECINVGDARQMLAKVQQQIADTDIFISAAAVMDYYCEPISEHKIKKSADHLTLTLAPTQDIIATVARMPNAPFTVGFAAETEQHIQHAIEKREAKGLNMIIVNDVSNPKIGFDSDDNAVTVISSSGRQTELAIASKPQIARQLLPLIIEEYHEAKNSS